MNRSRLVLRDFSIACSRFAADFSPHPIQRHQGRLIEVEQVGRRADPSRIDQLIDQPLAQSLDVQRPATRENAAAPACAGPRIRGRRCSAQ